MPKPLHILFVLAFLGVTAVPAASQDLADTVTVTTDPSNPLVGTWEMVSQRIIYPDSVVDRGQFLGPSYKILNDTHFAFGRQTIVRGEPQEDVYAGGGRYTLQGDSLYTEHIEYHSSIANVGLSIPFEYEMDGDLWYHRGRIGDTVLEEVWRRVEN